MENKISLLPNSSQCFYMKKMSEWSLWQPQALETTKVTLGHNQILFIFMFMHKNHDFHNRWLPKNTFKENKIKCIISITTWVSEG